MVPGLQSSRLAPPPFPFFSSPQLLSPNVEGPTNSTSSFDFSVKSEITSSKTRTDTLISESSSGLRSIKSLRRKLSQVTMTVRGNSIANTINGDALSVPNRKESEDVAGPRFRSESPAMEGQREAGDVIVYSDTHVRCPCLLFIQHTN